MLRNIVTLVLTLFVLTLPGAAFAANEVFTVRNVRVDATGEGSAQARDVAIANGRRVAFEQLMQRLTRREDWNNLPVVPDDQLNNLVLGFQVGEEQTSSTHYIAKVTYSFKPAAIRSLLRQAGIPFSEARAKPALVLPVLETQGSAVLWGTNPWLAAWAARDLGDDLVPILVPLNDLGDAGLISADQAKTATWSQVSAIAQKYGLDRVLIADASPGASGTNVALRQLSATADSSMQFSVPNGADPSAALDLAVGGALSRLYDEWKAATIVRFGQENSLVASVWFNSLQDWLTIRRRLGQAPTVTTVDVLGISSQGAEVRLLYAGTTDQLKITLEQISLELTNQGASWTIAMTDSAAPQASGSVNWPGAAGASSGYAPGGAPAPSPPPHS